MGEVKDAVSAWEQRIEGLEAAVKAVRAGLKMLEAARSGDATIRAWEAVEATREALVAYIEDEADKFKAVAEFQRQTMLDLDGTQARKPKGDAKPAGDPLPQEPLMLTTGNPPTDREGNILSGDPKPSPDGEEDPDHLLDGDDDDDDEDGDESDRGDLDGPDGDGDGERDEDARTEDEDED